MLNDINNFIMLIADPLLSWMLYLPQDVALILIALLTGLVLTGVRLFTTDQKYLERCKKDKARLKQLMREAKKNKDKEAVRRHRQTMGQIGMKSMAAEGKPLLASIIPIAIFAVWAFSRIAYIAPHADQDITMKMYFPLSSIDEYVHVLPVEGVECKSGWIQKVVDDVLPATNVADAAEENAEEHIAAVETAESGAAADASAVLNGVATWTFRAEQRDEPYRLLIRYGDRTIEKDLIVDGMRYSEPLLPYGDLFEEVIEFKAEEYKLFGVVPGIQSLMLAPWMMGYLLIVLPLAFVLKPIMRIH